MRLLTIIFLLVVCSLSAQVATDTTYQTNANGKFYEVRKVVNVDGSGSIVTTLVGDMATVFRSYLQSFVTNGMRMANEARSASLFDREITQMNQRNTAVLAATGRDILDTLTKIYSGPLLVSGWEITVDSLPVVVQFSVNANGQLRYTIAGFPARNALIIANTMRLNNYAATGKSIDLFKSPGGNWFSIDDRVKLRFPGNPSQNRVVVQPVKVDKLPIKIVPEKPKKKKKN